VILGYNTNGLAHHDLVQAIELLASIGYRGVAITLDHGALNPFDLQLLRQIERVKEALERHSMAVVIETGARFLLDPRNKHEPTLVSALRDARDRRIEFLKRAIDIGCELSAWCVSLWSGVVRDHTAGEEVRQRLVQSLLQVLRYAAERGMAVGFEPEPGMFVDTLDAYGKMLEQLRQCVPAEALPKLTIDIGHLHCQGETPISVKLREWADQIVNIHIEDMRGGIHEHLMFGEGEIDFSPILATLVEIGYNGPLNVELSRHSHCGPEAAAQAYWFLAPRIDAAKNASSNPDRS
jgi:sugar phosphate isomerase/epimerase